MSLKRTPMPAREKRLERHARIRKLNVNRARARDAKRSAAHRLFLKSAARRAVDERAQGQCEMWVKPLFNGPAVRCEETDALEFHHDRYPDVPGTETPDMVRKLCRGHHHAIERAEHPTRRNGRFV